MATYPVETIHRTRYAELGYVQDAPTLWRIVDLSGGLQGRVGPLYRTKTELLGDLERYAAAFGCASADKAPLRPQGADDFAQYRDALAACAHESWSGWMQYLFGESQQQPDGSVVIPASCVARWTRQMRMPYAELPMDEQSSDLDEADAIIDCVAQSKAP